MEFKRGPWTCRWARIAGALRSTPSVGSPDVIWTCGLRDQPSDTNLFLWEECEDCKRWKASACPPSAGPPGRPTLLLPDDSRPNLVVARTRHYERGDRIFDEGETSEFFYTATSGSVKLVKTSRQGNDSIVGIASGICPLNPDGLSFFATAVALEDTTCVLVPKRELAALIEEHPTAAQRLWDEMCEGLDAGFTWTAESGHGTVEVRLARFFLRLAETAGQRQGSATFIPIRLSRKELADAVGITIETSIRLMSRWEQRGFIYTRDGGFVVSDEEQLDLLAHAPPPHPQAH